MKSRLFTTIFFWITLMQAWGDPPATPLFVGAKGVTASQVNVAWFSTNSAGYYRIYRNGTQVGTVPVIPNNHTYKEPNMFQDIGLNPHTTYSYFVTAVDSSNVESTASSTISATTRPASQNGLIPSERLVNWVPGVTVGVPGGIPTDRTNIVDVTQAPYFADNTGASNASTAINAAIGNAVANDVVFLPAGTYRIDSTIYIAKSRITLRGAGLNQTIIDCRANGAVMFRGGDGFYNAPSFPVTAGAVQGSTQITVSDSSWMSVGHMLKISVENDPSLPVISVCGFPGVRSHNGRITSKNGNVLTIAPPLMLPTYSNTKAALHSLVTHGVGMEDLTIKGTAATTVGVTISGCYGSWMKNVRMMEIQNYILPLYDSLNCEIRKCVFEGGDILLPNHAGLLMGSSTGCLIEDNIVKNVFPAFEINSASTGNVFAYNYLIGSSTDLNHAPHNSFNLYEGNIMDGMMSDGYYGSDSEETIFRNWITGKSFPIALKRFSRNFNIVGNQIGTDGVHNGLYSFGQPNIGNGASTGFAVPSAGLYWLDWSAVTGLGITGTITTRASDSECTITLNSAGNLRLREYAFRLSTSASLHSIGVDWGSGKRLGMNGPSWTGNVIQLSGGYTDILPPVGTSVGLWPRAEGFQERDMDVLTTTILKANRYSGVSGYYLGVNENLEPGQTLPNSLYRTSKPDFFGSLAWPPFSPTNPVQLHDAIPAGYRYIHGREVPNVDWYVDNTVVSSGDGKTWGTAWKNLSDINWSVVQPGHSIYISGGVTSKIYAEPLILTAKNGSAGSPITIRPGSASPAPSGHEGLVVIRNASTATGGGNGILIYRSHIVVNGNSASDNSGSRNIRVTGCHAAGVNLSGSNSRISYLEIDNNGLLSKAGFNTDGVFLEGINSFNTREIDHNSIHDNWQDGIAGRTTNDVEGYGQLLIHHNEIYNVADDGMEVGGNGIDVYNNTIHKMYYFGPGDPRNRGAGHPDPIALLASGGNPLTGIKGGFARIWNNLFYDWGEFDRTGQGIYLNALPDDGDGLTQGSELTAIRIINNVAVGYRNSQAVSGSLGITFSPQAPKGGWFKSITDVIIANNTMVGFTDDGHAMNIYPSAMPGDGNNPVPYDPVIVNFFVLNNIIHDTGKRNWVGLQLGRDTGASWGLAGWGASPTGNIIFDYNVYSPGPAGGNLISWNGDTGPKYDYPQFKALNANRIYLPQRYTSNLGEMADPRLDANADYFPTEGSFNVIDQGRNLTTLPNYVVGLDSIFLADRLGNPRGAGAAWDIGAYEVVLPETDSDHDGLLDAWEIQYFGSISDPRALPDLDVDGDGMSNLSEQSAGTSPIDSKSRLIIVSQSLNEILGFTITWQSVSNKTYVVESSSNLTNWLPAASVDSISISTSWTDAASAGDRKFYRVKTP